MCPDLGEGSQGPLGGNSLVTEVDILQQRGTGIDFEKFTDVGSTVYLQLG